MNKMNKKIAVMLTSALLFSGAYAQKVLDFNFEENTVGEKSGVVLDKSPFENNGMLHSITPEGALIVEPGANGTQKALELHGGDDTISDYDSVIIDSNPSLSLTKDLTISAWIKKDSYDSPAFSGIVTKTYGAPAGVEPFRYAEYWFAVNKYGQLIFMDNSGLNVRTTESVVNDNEWVYVAVVRDKAKQELKFYVNGKLVETKTDIPATELKSSEYGVGVGACFPCKYPYKGKLDCVHIYNNALGDDAIKNDMDSCKLPDNEGNDDNNSEDNNSCSIEKWMKKWQHKHNKVKMPCAGKVDFKLPCNIDKFHKNCDIKCDSNKTQYAKRCFSKFMPKKRPCAGKVDFKLPCNAEKFHKNCDIKCDNNKTQYAKRCFSKFMPKRNIKVPCKK